MSAQRYRLRVVAPAGEPAGGIDHVVRIGESVFLRASDGADLDAVASALHELRADHVVVFRGDVDIVELVPIEEDDA